MRTSIAEQAKKKVCIIGCGTLGSYLSKRLLDRYGASLAITVVEIGNRQIRDEAQMGVTAEAGTSKVASHGRYFGLGGTSARWGGQILFFDDRDNPDGEGDWEEIIRINERYKSTVLQELLGPLPIESNDRNAPVKTGVWLGYTHRNLYRRLKRSHLRRIRLLTARRVADFEVSEGRIRSVQCVSADGKQQRIEADIFYLTAGALESCRLLLQLNANTGLLQHTALGRNFGDHISTELFRVFGAAPVLEGVDFTPRFLKGHLLTRRLVAPTSAGTVGFVHFVFNKDIRAFRFLKETLFGKRTTEVRFNDLLKGAGFLLRFAWHLLLRKTLYVDRGQWSVQLDMEQAVPNGNRLRLSEATDHYGAPVLKIDWDISAADKAAIDEVRTRVQQMLHREGFRYIACYQPGAVGHKIEDVYHPVGCIPVGHSATAVLTFTGRVKSLANLYHFSTAMLPSARSINPTAAVMCHIEAHLAEEPPL